MSLDSVSAQQQAPIHAPTATVQLIGTRWAVAAGHALAAEAAARGFPISAFSAYQRGANAEKYRRWPTSIPLLLRDGRAYRTGEILVQRELGETLRRMARAEAKAGGSREAGVRAARDEFYRGETARRIAEFHRAEGGPLAFEDLAEFSVEVAPALTTTFGAYEEIGRAS